MTIYSLQQISNSGELNSVDKIQKYELEVLCGHYEFPSPAAQFKNIQNQNKGKPLDLLGLSMHYAVADNQ